MRTFITGTGASIPAVEKTNQDFVTQRFYDKNQKVIAEPSASIIHKFQEITGIKARRYAPEGVMASDLALESARVAIADANIDQEKLDFILVANNFGDVIEHTIQSDFLPALACRVKHGLGIENPDCIAFDILIGCPGWIQCLIQADMMIRSGEARMGLVIGVETLSRVLDPYDRDSMIFSDGAGAVVVEGRDDNEGGMLSSKAITLTKTEAYHLFLGKSNFPGSDSRIRYIKMEGRKIYEGALTFVPQVMKTALDRSGLDVRDLRKIFIHQANEKMDEAIVARFYKLCGVSMPSGIMPMNISDLGNSSVATVPTLFHQVCKGEIPGQSVAKGDLILFVSVGAGLHVNAVAYRM
jgi:3-oxoacyl-[acyl-carrier-protein] synthase-3